MAEQTTTLRCTCPSVCILHSTTILPADPAQSAPSAEPRKVTGGLGGKFYLSPDGNWIIWDQQPSEYADAAHRGLFHALKEAKTRAETAESALRVKEFELETANANHKVMADALRDVREKAIQECIAETESFLSIGAKEVVVNRLRSLLNKEEQNDVSKA